MLATATAAGGTTAPRTLDPFATGWLPSQGLVVARAHDVLLVGLDGRVLGRLAGFRLAPSSGDFLLDGLAEAVAGPSYLTPQPLLLGPHGRPWELAGGRLEPLARGVVPLPGGAEVDGHMTGSPSDREAVIDVRDTRTGRILVPAHRYGWFVADGGLLLATHHILTDLVTHEQWTLPHGVSWTEGTGGVSTCNPAGLARDSVIALCAYVGPHFAHHSNSVVRVFSVAHDGKRTLLGGPFLYGNFGAMSAVLSPDREHIGATLAVGCGLSPSIVAPTQGGTPRYIDGSTDRAPGRHTQSYVLGWSWQGKLVAEFARGECEKESTPGIYLVDPTTFVRSLVFTLGSGTRGYAMWNAQPDALD